jgi:hypothetical protein
MSPLARFSSVTILENTVFDLMYLQGMLYVRCMISYKPAEDHSHAEHPYAEELTRVNRSVYIPVLLVSRISAPCLAASLIGLQLNYLR